MGKNRGMGVRPLVDKAGPTVSAELGPCWLWIGAKADNGYGLRWVDGKRVRAHRQAYREAFGVDPGQLKVCHRCDVPACVNPGHLFLGTDADNKADARAKGRHARGSMMGGAKLTEPDVLHIRKRLLAGHSPRDIAKDYNVKHATIKAIREGRTWAWFQGEV